ncbi:MAG: hypothetical protein HQL24_02595 [Candidatus Omnitrophica bacterium]|nr:hypothetical protein [Candidatus Omnitrophota bacterium]
MLIIVSIYLLIIVGGSILILLNMLRQDKEIDRLTQDLDRVNQSFLEQQSQGQGNAQEMEKALREKDLFISNANDEIQKTHNEAFRLRTELQSQIDKFNQQSSDILKLTQQAQQLKQEKNALEEKLTNAQANTQKEKEAQKLVADKDVLLKQKDAELKEIKTQIDNLNATINQKTEDLRIKNQEIQNLQDSLKQLESSQKNSAEALKNLEIVKSELAQKIEVLKKSDLEIQKLQASLKQMESSQAGLTDAAKNLDAVKIELAQKTEALKKSDLEIQKLQASLKQMESSQIGFVDAAKNLEAMKLELAQKTEAIKKADADIQDLKGQLERAMEIKNFEIEKEKQKWDTSIREKNGLLQRLESEIQLIQSALHVQIQDSKEMRRRLDEQHAKVRLLGEKTKENSELIAQL